MPLVTSGMAARPPVPVDTVVPVPSRLNHVSIVNVAALRPGAGPNVTRLVEPSNRRPLFADTTVIVAVSLTVNWPSLAVSASTYVPAAEKVAVVEAAFGLANVTVPGPLDLLQEIVSALSMSTAVPASVAAAGSV